jgi:hypothetical protein
MSFAIFRSEALAGHPAPATGPRFRNALEGFYTVLNQALLPAGPFDRASHPTDQLCMHSDPFSDTLFRRWIGELGWRLHSPHSFPGRGSSETLHRAHHDDGFTRLDAVGESWLTPNRTEIRLKVLSICAPRRFLIRSESLTSFGRSSSDFSFC